MAARSRVDLFEAIRRDARREELSVRALARRHGTHRRTVRRALASALLPPRRAPARAAPKLDPARPLIDGMLRADLEAPRKQRHTARRVLARLVDEHGMSGLSYSTVRDYVDRRRPEILAEAGRAAAEACVPQSYEPGAQAEVDFADLWIDLAGVRTKVFLFTLRLSYSGRAVHRVFATQGQEAFLEGHVSAFSRLGGVPADKIRYDNLKSAVSRVLFGRNRLECNASDFVHQIGVELPSHGSARLTGWEVVHGVRSERAEQEATPAVVPEREVRDLRGGAHRAGDAAGGGRPVRGWTGRRSCTCAGSPSRGAGRARGLAAGPLGVVGRGRGVGGRLMDEPFRAPDAMTRDVLHDELERLWAARGVSVLVVTHNVREAARLGDRIVLLSSRPGRVVDEFAVDVPRPRHIDSPEVSVLAAAVTDRLREEVRRHGR